jgi:hypothetical protein
MLSLPAGNPVRPDQVRRLWRSVRRGNLTGADDALVYGRDRRSAGFDDEKPPLRKHEISRAGPRSFYVRSNLFNVSFSHLREEN